jgi:hypothetical protein
MTGRCQKVGMLARQERSSQKSEKSLDNNIRTTEPIRIRVAPSNSPSIGLQVRGGTNMIR